jgi:hypothetical protein
LGVVRRELGSESDKGMSGACGKRVGEVLKLFKKTLSLKGPSPSFTIERKKEFGCTVSIRGFFTFSTGEIRS